MADRRDDIDSTDVARRYVAGESIRQIAASLHTGYGTVYNRLTTANVELRGRGAAPRRGAARATG